MSVGQRVSGMIVPKGLKQMNTTDLGKIVDYIYKLVKPRFPDETPEDVYGVIYKKVKKSNLKNMRFDKPDLQEDFILNVKPRRYPTEPTPITTALGVGRRITRSNI